MNTSPPTIRSGLLSSFVALGLALVLVSLAIEPVLGWAGLLVGAVFGLTIAIGGALFASICLATGAQWWEPIKSTCVSIARLLPIPAIALALVVGLGVTTLYPWANDAFLAESHLVHGKTGWLNHGFFAARTAGILLLWFVFVAALRKGLASGSATRFARTGVGFLLIFGVSISVGFWDWTMSLEPEWFSTMHGVYGFAGAFQVGIAVTLMIAVRNPKISAKPLFDLGTLLLAFSAFWGYIWYCQGMLIWYANIPEETFHYANALSNGWSTLFWLNPILNLALPLFMLMSRHARRSRLMLGQVALLVVVGHFLDILLLVGPSAGRYNTPEVGGASSLMPLAAVGAALAVGSGMMLLHRRLKE
jgi:hypothetical protein